VAGFRTTVRIPRCEAKERGGVPNQTISFAKENPTFAGNSSIQFAVNCNGEIGGGFHVVIKSGNDTLDNEIIEFLKTIKTWKPGMIKKKTVDSWYMWRLEIKNGYIDITN